MLRRRLEGHALCFALSKIPFVLDADFTLSISSDIPALTATISFSSGFIGDSKSQILVETSAPNLLQEQSMTTETANFFLKDSIKGHSSSHE
jgi:hypothetical protein